MDTPSPPPPDPYLIAQEQKAQQDQANALQVEAQGDTANLMARYGTRLAMASAASSTSTAANGIASFMSAVGRGPAL